MRRPTPLPPPAGSPPPRATPAPQAVGADSGEGAPDLAPTAPVIPLVRPTDATDAVTSDVGPTDSGRELTPPREGGAEAPVGLRDLWRASRARRRALRAEVRRFTVRQRRRRAVWLGVLVSLVVLVAATVGAAYSPLFAVERIEVVGTSQLDPQTVETALAGQLGTPLAAIDESAVKAALIGFPLVQSYTLEAAPPHDLVVRIVERTPIGVISGPAGYTLVDAAGVALSTSASPPAGYPSLDATPGSDAFAAAGQVVRSLPAQLRSQLTTVSATSAYDVTLTLGPSKVVWGSADESAKKALVLDDIMRSRPGASVYDVSSPTAVVVS